MTVVESAPNRGTPRYGEGRRALLAAAMHVGASREPRNLMYRLVAAEARVAHGLVASSRAGRTGPPFARAVDHPDPTCCTPPWPPWQPDRSERDSSRSAADGVIVHTDRRPMAARGLAGAESAKLPREGEYPETGSGRTAR
jgi:hypothetical protein